MRRINTVGVVTGTLPGNVASLCNAHGNVADYDAATNIVTCIDTVRCNGSSGVCDDAATAAAAACSAQVAMKWDGALIECVVDPSDPATAGLKASCSATTGYHWDDTFGCVADSPAPTATYCAVGGCDGTMIAGTCVPNDPKCVAPALAHSKPAGPDSSLAASSAAAAATTLTMASAATKAYSADPKNTCKSNALKLASIAYQAAQAWQKNPASSALSSAWTAAYSSAFSAIAACGNGKQSGQSLPTKVDCDASGGTWDASKAVCTPKSSNTMLYVGGAGLLALALYLATRKKGSKR